MTKHKEKNTATPVEKHDTAAWADIEKTKSKSKVSIPHEANVKNAKEYVDSNEK
ncbi:MAG: DUF3787 domain-containing protein [Firmicutes bacterium]|nr:DUF3787 domain-containing protein [Bacillota bacterium]